MSRPAYARVFLIFVFAVSTLLFQNCSKSNFSKDSSSDNSNNQNGAAPSSVDSLGPKALLNDQVIKVQLSVPKDFSVADIASANNITLVGLDLIDVRGNVITSTQTGTASIQQTSNDHFQFVTQSIDPTTLKFQATDSNNNPIIFQIRFETMSDFLKWRPTLAVRNPRCLVCHANIHGNMITDFNANGSEVVLSSSDFALLQDGQRQYGAYSGFLSTFISGTIFTKKANLSPDSILLAQHTITEAKKNMEHTFTTAEGNPQNFTGAMLKPMAASDVLTVAQYLKAIMQRTSSYLTYINAFPSYEKNIASPSLVVTPVEELNTLKITAPTQAELRSFIEAGATKNYFKKASSLPLEGLIEGSNYFTNSLSGPLVCDGDLVLDKPLLLSNLKLKTKEGCRIYSTKPIFVEGRFLSGDSAIQYIDADGTDRTSLQLSSSMLVGFGFGYCGAGASTLTLRDGNGFDYKPFMPFMAAVRREDGSTPTDAGDCQRKAAPSTDAARVIHLSRVLANAPRVDSRYTGDFKGAIIATESLFALGRFRFTYDPVFNNVTVLPILKPYQFFEAAK